MAPSWLQLPYTCCLQVVPVFLSLALGLSLSVFPFLEFIFPSMPFNSIWQLECRARYLYEELSACMFPLFIENSEEGSWHPPLRIYSIPGPPGFYKWWDAHAGQFKYFLSTSQFSVLHLWTLWRRTHWFGDFINIPLPKLTDAMVKSIALASCLRGILISLTGLSDVFCYQAQIARHDLWNGRDQVDFSSISCQGQRSDRISAITSTKLGWVLNARP